MTKQILQLTVQRQEINTKKEGRSRRNNVSLLVLFMLAVYVVDQVRQKITDTNYVGYSTNKYIVFGGSVDSDSDSDSDSSSSNSSNSNEEDNDGNTETTTSNAATTTTTTTTTTRSHPLLISNHNPKAAVISHRSTGNSSDDDDNFCTNMDDMNDGAWNNHTWVPKRCHLRTFDDPTQIKQCLKDKNVAFCGDSLLRNIAMNIGQRIDASLAFKETWGDQSFPLIGLNTYWTPSVFHQQCSSSYGSTMIISETVWDMGVYFEGVGAYESSLRQVLHLFKDNKRLIWFGLHKLHRERPACRKDPKCYENNAPEMEATFREIGLRVARESGAEIFDTRGITNTTFSALDGDDAVHYGGTTTKVEADVLLNMIC